MFIYAFRHLVLGDEPRDRSGNVLTQSWQKMSKSKHNGVDPKQVLDTYGVDTTRLCVVAGAAPKSERNWTDDSVFLLLIYLPFLSGTTKSWSLVQLCCSFPRCRGVAGKDLEISRCLFEREKPADASQRVER